MQCILAGSAVQDFNTFETQRHEHDDFVHKLEGYACEAYASSTSSSMSSDILEEVEEG